MALLAVMTVGLAAALQGRSILWPFVTGAAAAYALAAAVGLSRVATTVAAVRIDGADVTLQSVWEAATPPIHPAPQPVSSVRVAYGELTAGIGDTIVSFHRDDWAAFDELVEALRGASRLSEDGPG